jgi:hypothetical protein
MSCRVSYISTRWACILVSARGNGRSYKHSYTSTNLPITTSQAEGLTIEHESVIFTLQLQPLQSRHGHRDGMATYDIYKVRVPKT